MGLGSPQLCDLPMLSIHRGKFPHWFHTLYPSSYNQTVERKSINITHIYGNLYFQLYKFIFVEISCILWYYWWISTNQAMASVAKFSVAFQQNANISKFFIVDITHWVSMMCITSSMECNYEKKQVYEVHIGQAVSKWYRCICYTKHWFLKV